MRRRPVAAGRSERSRPRRRSRRRPERRLFEDGRFFHADGKREVPLRCSRGRCRSRPMRSIPFLLLTGRGTSSQWHTQTRTAKVRRAAQALSRARSTSRSTRSTPSGSASRRTTRSTHRLAPRRDRRARFRHRRPCSPARSSSRCTTREANRLTYPCLRSLLAPAVATRRAPSRSRRGPAWGPSTARRGKGRKTSARRSGARGRADRGGARRDELVGRRGVEGEHFEVVRDDERRAASSWRARRLRCLQDCPRLAAPDRDH